MNDVEGSEQSPLTADSPGSGGAQRTCPGCDSIFSIIELPVFWYIGALWLLAVLTAGAGFLLTLMGVCGASTAWCYSFLNTNNQILTALFTAVNLYVLPGRTLRAWGVVSGNGSPRCSFSPQRSLLAESYDPESFYHISWGLRASISFLLILSTFSQFVNQGFHVYYATYETSMRWPGVLWNNLFFLISLATMVAAMGLEGFEDIKVRTKWPRKFPPTAAVIVTERLHSICCAKSTW
mmetsp:Transcript_45779/g.92397  ORF Transcript_45779/g.92397 Transcript_45779/m.92397 type:complete len:237 (-) Transcript_45779:282-992(-)